MSKYESIIVCGCIRNGEKYIYENLTKLYEINTICAKFHFVVYENDSIDNTVKILDSFKNTHDKFNYISEKNVNNPSRPHMIAHGRNTLLKYVHEININEDTYDYMIMVDLDDVICKFNVKQMSNLFKTDDWDALFANCIGKYYDIWAFRIENDIWGNIHNQLWQNVIDYDCWEKAKQYKTTKYISNNQIIIPVKYPNIPVSSAFGGFGIYKISKIQNCGYVAEHNNRLRCEHVAFNMQIRQKNNAKLFICPSFLVNSQPQHIIKVHEIV